MEIKKKNITAAGVEFSVREDNKKIGSAYLYLMRNNLHQRPFGLLEDVMIAAEYRGRGVGTKLIKEILLEAKNRNCYKIIATSRYARPRVHALYKKLGFADYGKEFRIDF